MGFTVVGHENLMPTITWRSCADLTVERTDRYSKPRLLPTVTIRRRRNVAYLYYADRSSQLLARICLTRNVSRIELRQHATEACLAKRLYADKPLHLPF